LAKSGTEAIVFDTTPHAVFDYPLYALARQYNIETLLFYTIPFTDYIYPRYSIYFEDEKDRYLFPEKKKSKPPESWDDFVDIKTKSYEKAEPNRISKIRQTKRQYDIPKFSENYNWLLSALRRPRVTVEYISSKLKQAYRWRRIENHYRLISKEPSLSRDYIYIPLHFQPERTTSPEGGKFSDQARLIKMVNRAKPDCWQIYVREHPSQFKNRQGWMGRSVEFYDRLRVNDSIKIICMNISPFTLIDNAKAVISVAGTSSVEAIIRNTPSTVSGYPWFYPGISRPIKSEKTTRQWLEGKYGSVEKQKGVLFAFFNKLDSMMFLGYNESSCRNTETTSSSECINNISKSIYTYLLGHT
jgi:hypothetical protein